MWGIRRSVKKRICKAIALIVVQGLVLCLCQTVVKHIVTKKYETELAEKERILEEAGRLVYITREEVRAGEEFTEANVEKQYVLSQQDKNLLETDAIGAVACVDLPAGTILNTSVCQKTEYGLSERKCTFRNIDFADCFAEYDVVDVRIRYENGENYCVLSKKRLLPTEKEEECCFVLNEEEQLMMSGATFDAEMYEGAELYLVGIPNEWEEAEPVSRFLPPLSVLSQLQELDEGGETFSETWAERRTALEQRLLEHRKQRKEGLL